jgi:hypothetical protein
MRTTNSRCLYSEDPETNYQPVANIPAKENGGFQFRGGSTMIEMSDLRTMQQVTSHCSVLSSTAHGNTPIIPQEGECNLKLGRGQ